jgi:Zn finger protein HypA/HybF involved in hydrogenase expression
MHEMSIALEICRIAEERVGHDRLANVRTVGLEVGKEAGVDPESLRFCLEVLLSQPPFRQATPDILLRPSDTLKVTYLIVDDGEPAQVEAPS